MWLRSIVSVFVFLFLFSLSGLALAQQYGYGWQDQGRYGQGYDQGQGYGQGQYGQGYGQGQYGQGYGRGGCPLAQYNLSPEQERTYRNIVREYQDKTFDKEDELLQKQNRLNYLYQNPEADEEKIQELTKDIRSLRRELYNLYREMEDRLEKEVGISGNWSACPFAGPRSGMMYGPGMGSGMMGGPGMRSGPMHYGPGGPGMMNQPRMRRGYPY